MSVLSEVFERMRLDAELAEGAAAAPGESARSAAVKMLGLLPPDVVALSLLRASVKALGGVEGCERLLEDVIEFLRVKSEADGLSPLHMVPVLALVLLTAVQSSGLNSEKSVSVAEAVVRLHAKEGGVSGERG